MGLPAGEKKGLPALPSLPLNMLGPDGRKKKVQAKENVPPQRLGMSNMGGLKRSASVSCARSFARTASSSNLRPVAERPLAQSSVLHRRSMTDMRQLKSANYFTHVTQEDDKTAAKKKENYLRERRGSRVSRAETIEDLYDNVDAVDWDEPEANATDDDDIDSTSISLSSLALTLDNIGPGRVTKKNFNNVCKVKKNLKKPKAQSSQKSGEGS